jgi:hypothetical protein
VKERSLCGAILLAVLAVVLGRGTGWRAGLANADGYPGT